MNGTLASRPLGPLLADLRQAGRSGILTLTRRDIRKQICIVKGLIRFAASNVRAAGCAVFLKRHGIVPAETLDSAEQLLSNGQRLGPLLVEMGAIPMARLREEARRHILHMVFPCMDWTDGQYSFTEGVPGIAGEVHVEVSPI